MFSPLQRNDYWWYQQRVHIWLSECILIKQKTWKGKRRLLQRGLIASCRFWFFVFCFCCFKENRLLKLTFHFYFPRRKIICAKDILSISFINSVQLSWHAWEADRLVMSITFASTFTAPGGSGESRKVC